METIFYCALFQQSPFGFAFSRIITDESGAAIDFEIIDANASFWRAVARRLAPQRSGRGGEYFAPNADNSFAWMPFFAEIACRWRVQGVELDSRSLDRWFRLWAYPQQNCFFVITLIDTTIIAPIRELENSFP
jgi:hypothetical protein